MLYSGCTSKAVCRRLMISGILSGCEGLCFPVTASCCLARAMTSASVPASLCMNSGRIVSVLSLTAASCFCSVRSAAAMFLHQKQGRSDPRESDGRIQRQQSACLAASACCIQNSDWILSSLCLEAASCLCRVCSAAVIFAPLDTLHA